eukprot:14975256-Alexandrium_andersonii.AAC.1
MSAQQLALSSRLCLRHASLPAGATDYRGYPFLLITRKNLVQLVQSFTTGLGTSGSCDAEAAERRRAVQLANNVCDRCTFVGGGFGLPVLEEVLAELGVHVAESTLKHLDRAVAHSLLSSKPQPQPASASSSSPAPKHAP